MNKVTGADTTERIKRVKSVLWKDLKIDIPWQQDQAKEMEQINSQEQESRITAGTLRPVTAPRVAAEAPGTATNSSAPPPPPREMQVQACRLQDGREGACSALVRLLQPWYQRYLRLGPQAHRCRSPNRTLASQLQKPGKMLQHSQVRVISGMQTWLKIDIMSHNRFKGKRLLSQ